MSDLATINALLSYSDKTNRLVFQSADQLSDDLLSKSIDIGLGSLRRILIHVYSGELVWLARWQGNVETPWPNEAQNHSPGEMLKMLEEVIERRTQFITTLTDSSLGKMQTYRDSKGSLFKATLRDMILQGITHSTHHRAQIVNAIRRLSGNVIEVDYMVSVRQPA